MNSILEEVKCEKNASGVGHGGMASCEIGDLPTWLVSVYLIGNTALSLLNFYWFSQMIQAVRKRFVPKEQGKGGNKNVKKAQ